MARRAGAVRQLARGADGRAVQPRDRAGTVDLSGGRQARARGGAGLAQDDGGGSGGESRRVVRGLIAPLPCAVALATASPRSARRSPSPPAGASPPPTPRRPSNERGRGRSAD